MGNGNFSMYDGSVLFTYWRGKIGKITKKSEEKLRGREKGREDKRDRGKNEVENDEEAAWFFKKKIWDLKSELCSIFILVSK